MSEPVRFLLLAAGSLCIAVGVIGIFVPVLPTTPFLLLGAACYARGSRRFYEWLMGHRVLGTYIRNYREGRGMARRAKIGTLCLLWVSLFCSAYAMGIKPAIWLLLLAVGLGVTLHLAKLPTYRPAEQQTASAARPSSGPEESDAAADGGDQPS